MHRLRVSLAAATMVCLGLAIPSVAQTPFTVAYDSAWSTSTTPGDLSKARQPPPRARLANVSIRALTGTGADALMAGAVLRGNGTAPVLVRAIGPGLARFGISNYLRLPNLDVYRDATLAAQTNTAVAVAGAASSFVGTFPLIAPPTGEATGDAALVGQPTAGPITAHCTAASGAAGVALLEFYDATAAPTADSARFVNFSARSRVEAGEGVAVTGFVVSGEGQVTLLLRAVGPTLERFGLAGFLADPVVQLYAGNSLIASNDNWRSGTGAGSEVETAANAAGAFVLASASDAALVVTLGAGSYTLQVRDSAGRSGIALTEIYEIAATGFDAAQSVNATGLDLYRQLAPAKPGENLVLSPYSIESALALAYAGSDGNTRTEMARVLHLPDDTTSLQVGLAGLRTALDVMSDQSKRAADARTAAGRPTDPIQWHAANRLFGQQGYAFRDSFLTLMRDGFAAPFEPLDFRFHLEPSRLTINAWVEEQTRQKIKDLIPAGALTEDTRLVLVNALYLNAPWETPFEAASTAPRAFYPTPATSRPVPTMMATVSGGYTTEDGFTVATLDYLDRGLQFVIILPDESGSVDAVAARLTSAHFARWAKLSDTNRRSLALSLPKFKVEGGTIPLGQALRTMGMTTAFDVPRGTANFDRIAPRRPDEYLAISEVYHQTYIALDEQGTEAAAATAVVIIVVTSQPSPPITVRVDRPFLFAIQHRASGACLFLGRIANP